MILEFIIQYFYHIFTHSSLRNNITDLHLFCWDTMVWNTSFNKLYLHAFLIYLYPTRMIIFAKMLQFYNNKTTAIVSSMEKRPQRKVKTRLLERLTHKAPKMQKTKLRLQRLEGKHCRSRWDGSLLAILSGSTVFANSGIVVFGALRANFINFPFLFCHANNAKTIIFNSNLIITFYHFLKKWRIFIGFSFISQANDQIAFNSNTWDEGGGGVGEIINSLQHCFRLLMIYDKQSKCW